MLRHKLFWKRCRAPRGRKGILRRSWHVLRWSFRLLLVLFIADLFYLGVTWPDWKKLAAGPVPKSAFMVEYEKERVHHKNWPRLRWHPVPLSTIPKYFIRAVILGEDSRFYEHSGFDLIAFKEAMEYNLREGRFVLGASTISQQTVKNLFLSPARNPLRKWHELILTWGMEHNLSKRRILELYLNIAQFGRGIYGVQAASQAYWGIDPEQMSVAEAAELAATLPGPVDNNPVDQTRYFVKRSKKILALVERYPGNAAQAVRARMELLAPPPEDNSATDEPPPEENPPPSAENPPEPPAQQAPEEGDANKAPVEDRSVPAPVPAPPL
ncbi:MAG: monofunctional biosynthetic peptidoglycan transglycosylase [Sulfuricaulis sp.]